MNNEMANKYVRQIEAMAKRAQVWRKENAGREAKIQFNFPSSTFVAAPISTAIEEKLVVTNGAGLELIRQLWPEDDRHEPTVFMIRMALEHEPRKAIIIGEPRKAIIIGEPRRVELQHCPQCHGPLSGSTALGESDGSPEPGSFTVCAYCATILRHGEDLKLRLLNADDNAELAAEKELQKLLNAAVSAIKSHPFPRP